MSGKIKLSLVVVSVVLLLFFSLSLTGCVENGGEEENDEEIFDLTIDTEGEGTVEIDPDKDEFERNTEVTLTAEPDDEWYFDEWTGDYTSTEEVINITMDEDKSLTANFDTDETITYHLTIDTEGEGTVEIDPDQDQFERNTEVTLTAEPNDEWELDKWEGTDETGEEITINMNEDKEITAVFGEEDSTIEIEDKTGVEITFEEPPERIISFMPSNTEILFHLEIGDRVVGVDDLSNYPEEVNELPSVGDAFEVDYEEIVDLEPDVVVIQEANIQMRQQLDEYGIESVVTSGESLSDVYSDMELLGEMCGVEERAQEKVEELENEMSEITNETKDLPSEERTDVLYVSGTYDGINTPGDDTFQGTLLNNAGGNNIAYDVDGWGNIDEEDVIDRDPEVIIAPESVQQDLEEYTEKESWEEITAVEEEEIHYVDADIISRPGPRVDQAQEELVEILSPLE